MHYNYLLKLDIPLNDKLAEAAAKQTLVWLNSEGSFKRPWRIDYLGIYKFNDSDIFDTANFAISGLPFPLSGIYDMKTFVSTIMSSSLKSLLGNTVLIPLNDRETKHIFKHRQGTLGDDLLWVDYMSDTEKKAYYDDLKIRYYDYNLEDLLTKELNQRYERFMETNINTALTSEELELLGKKKKSFEAKALMLQAEYSPLRLEGRKAIIGKMPVFMCSKNVTIPNYFKIIEGLEAVIDEDAFNGCDQLESIQIPPGITKIGQRAFMDCRGLSEVTIPQGVTEIGAYAFLGCTNLQRIVMPASIECIADDFFWTEAEIICPENSYVHSRAVEFGREVTL